MSESEKSQAFRFPRFCRLALNYSVLAGQFIERKALPDHASNGNAEPLSIRKPAIIETPYLLVEVAE
jgi:hypothetical protein